MLERARHRLAPRLAKLVELEGIRRELSTHPFLYDSGWSKRVATAAKKAVRLHKGAPGLLVLIAFGCVAKEAPKFYADTGSANAARLEHGKAARAAIAERRCRL